MPDELVEVIHTYGGAFLKVAGYAVLREGDICRDLHIIVDEGVPVKEALLQHHVWNVERMERIAKKAKEFLGTHA